MHSDPVDAYIDKAQPFARRILLHLRKLAHVAEPEAEEARRWGVPFFILEGRQLCGMAAFKGHCAFILETNEDEKKDAMGSFGRITNLDDLPDDAEIIALIREKAARIRSGEDIAASRRKAARPVETIAMPVDFASALAKSEGAQAVWEGFTDAQRRDYLEWVTTAKRDATRQKRIASAAEWIGEGKRRNWRYEKC